MTDKEQIIIDGIILNDVKKLLFTGQRNSITTSTFEKIIDFLEEKMQECNELKKECENIKTEARELFNAKCELLRDLDHYKRAYYGCAKRIKERLVLPAPLPPPEFLDDRYRKALEEIQILAGKIISSDDQPACVYDVECPLNGGVGFDNHCNENCPFISAKQILNIINKAKGKL